MGPVRIGWKKTVGLGVLASALYAVWRATEHHGSPTVTWEPQPFPFPPQPKDPAPPGAAPPD